MQPTYIVGGWQRCGTSMMMESLIAGGMEAIFSRERTKAMNANAGSETYVPNREYFEPGIEHLRSAKWPHMCAGRLFKMLQNGPLNLSLSGFHMNIVYMCRDPHEAFESYRAAFGKNPPGTRNPQHLWQRHQENLQKMMLRHDMTVVPVWYNNTRDYPGQVFEDLWNRGWPIDPQRAAETVKPELKRFHFNNAKVFGTEYEVTEWDDPRETLDLVA